MAELNNNEPQSRSKKPHAKKLSTRIDMTPMVDLAFLLLTFFMLTTTFNKPQVMEINMPIPKGDSTPVPENTVTVLLGAKGKITYYQGMFDKKTQEEFHKSTFSDNQIRRDLMNLNQKLINRVSEIEDDYTNGRINEDTYKKQLNEAKKTRNNDGVFAIIKVTDDAPYQSLVSIIDEMKICNMVNYAIVDITKEEEKILALK